MRLLKVYIFFGGMIIFSCSHAKHPQNEKASQAMKNKNNLELAGEDTYNDVLNFINSNLSKWTVLDIKIFAKEWKQFCEGNNKFPYCISGDFNGDSLSDYAFILRNGNNLALFAFNRNKNQSFNYFKLKNISEKVDVPIEIGLFIQEKGLVTGIGSENDKEDPQVNLNNEGIGLIYFEKSSLLFFWDKVKYKEFPLGD